MIKSTDIIVIGGGHAGVEAVSASARMGVQVLLITIDKNKIGEMSCNPAIGGIGKGHIVRAIDALGGLMGKCADKAGIQFKVLNASKGPAVRGPRCQADRAKYKKAINEELSKYKNVKILNFGGGLKIPYFEGDSKTNILNLSNSIKKLINDNSFVTENNLKIILEPGKFLVGESGYFLTKVNYVKKTPNKVFVQLNSGFNHFIRPIFYDSYHEIINITNPNDKEYEYDVVGYVCEQDNFALKRKISNVRKGDILCFKNAGAYCSSMSSNYNSRIKPAEACIWKNKLVKIKERENLNNILNGQIDIF